MAFSCVGVLIFGHNYASIVWYSMFGFKVEIVNIRSTHIFRYKSTQGTRNINSGPNTNRIQAATVAVLHVTHYITHNIMQLFL